MLEYRNLLPAGCSTSSNSSVIDSKQEHHLGAGPKAGTKYCNIFVVSFAKNNNPKKFF